MTHLHPPLICAIVLVLTGCTAPREFPPLALPDGTVPAPGALPPGRADLAGCGGDKIAYLIGEPLADLPASGGWGALRILHPGMMMTMDFSASRLNVFVDGTGLIRDMSCG